VKQLWPLSHDRARAVALTREALAAQNGSADGADPFQSILEREVAEGRALGRLWGDGSRSAGLAVWEPTTTLGADVRLLYLEPGASSASAYAAFLRELARSTGPVAFAPANLAGLGPEEEAEMMAGLGFARFARSEMRLPPSAAPPPDGEVEVAVRSRPATRVDIDELARLYARAYDRTFDRYLFLVNLDLARDAELAIREILDGRWGEFLPWASPVVEGEGALSAASLVVRAPYGPLVADVMVDPAAQGRGLGRAVLGESVRALRAKGETVIVLNVTEGNRRAIRLYERLGFVRSLGPSFGWYSTELIPVPPDPI
jgi:N-alpha-acetyltransferase 10/11